MELPMRVRFEIIKKTSQRYKVAKKGDKKHILDEFTSLTGYTRKYASWILAHWNIEVSFKIKTTQVRYVVGKRKIKPRSGRPKKYDEYFLTILLELWYLFDCLCGKRFAPFLKETAPVLLSFGELSITDDILKKLLSASSATLDRLIKPERDKCRLHGRSFTKHGSLLKKQIPISTFADWDDAVPGFTEIDLVAHEGGSAFGEFHCTLTVTDVATGWTENVAVQNKAQKWVFEAIKLVRTQLPFPLLGIDSDNGSEFINAHLLNYCQDEHIQFTRSRAYRKNDNCFVEQKNNSVVRRAVGYARFDTPESLSLLNSLYDKLRIITNFYLPSAKLLLKTRDGAKLIRKHDLPTTPYKRVLAEQSVKEEVKKKLQEQYAAINPAQLAREIQTIQEQLDKSSTEVHYSTKGQYISYVTARNRMLSGPVSS